VGAAIAVHAGLSAIKRVTQQRDNSAPSAGNEGGHQ
jgi:hypothetical protein